MPKNRAEERGTRVAENEAIFRRANERLRETYRAFGADERHLPFICECADTRCTRVVMLTPDEYEDVRAHPDRFLLLHGHELLELERIVDENERFQVVAKHDRTAGAADAP